MNLPRRGNPVVRKKIRDSIPHRQKKTRIESMPQAADILFADGSDNAQVRKIYIEGGRRHEQECSL